MNKHSSGIARYFVLLLCAGISLTSRAQLHIIPQPLHVTAQKGTFVLTGTAVIGADKESEAIGIYLKEYLAKNYKLNLRLKIYQHVPAAVAIGLVTTKTNKEGAYTMSVKPTGMK
ncbi:MAG TPA: glycoside hydrolase family 20 zincin-like fold domain-containing protein, partial [Mucilaginibacter sp.]